MSRFYRNPNEVDILRLLCDKEGVIRLSEFHERDIFPSLEAGKSFLQRYPHFFRLERIQGSDYEVHAHTRAEICDEYDSKDDDCFNGDCANFHLCKHFVTGNCKFGKRCVSSHQLRSEHNQEVLEINQLDELDDEIILQLLKLSCVECTVPDVCLFYNRRRCTKGNSCPFLHVCLHYIKGDCRFTNANLQQCRLSHNILDKQPRQVLQKYGIDVHQNPVDLVHKIRYKKRCEDGEDGSDIDDQDDAYSNYRGEARNELRQLTSVTSRRSTPVLPAAQLERQSSSAPVYDFICVFHLGGQCNYGEKCFNLHADEPFQWQYKGGDKWNNFDRNTNLRIEKAYCDASQNAILLNITNADQAGVMNFKTLTLEVKVKRVPMSLKIRRIAPRSESQGWRKAYATTWLWYWLDEDGYVEYMKRSKKGTQASIDSVTIEDAYRKYQSGDQDQKRMKFGTDRHRYEINFETMKQKNLILNTKRSLKRRPQFASKKDVSDRAKSYKDMPSTVSVPEAWNLDAMSEVGTSNPFIICSVSSGLGEYGNVRRRFQETMSSATIISIKRVQSMDLWDDFSRKKGKMERKNNGETVREEMLFHGTSDAVVDVICQQNFDHRLSGTRSGARYGHGTYFHKNAKYSDRYASPDFRGQKRMFLARVLVGSCVKGNKELRRPPPKDPKKPMEDLHDTCVDDEKIPSIFVTFENSQVYPEYIITYIQF